jgi:hypothetical protein
MSFQEQLERSRQWEIAVGDWLRSRGCYVLPAYDYSGKDDDKAPRLQSPDGCTDLVIPDLAVFKRDTAGRWVEVKVKSCADEYRIGGYRVTGFSLRHWEHYQQVQEISGTEVLMIFIHMAEREVRAATLDALAGPLLSHRYTGSRMGRHGMVFFRYDEMPRWGGLDLLSAPGLDCGPSGMEAEG